MQFKGVNETGVDLKNLQRKLIVIRHGQTDYNLERRYQGQLDVPLNKIGLRQAHQSAEALCTVISELTTSSGLKRCRLTSSDLKRASVTADVISGVLKQRFTTEVAYDLTSLLREQCTGLLQDHTHEEFQKKHPELLKAYEEAQSFSAHHARPPGLMGESQFEVGKRLRTLLSQTYLENQNDDPDTLHIWCTHGWVINVLVDMIGAQLSGTDTYVGNGDVVMFGLDALTTPSTKIGRELELNLSGKVLRQIEVGERLGSVAHVRKLA